MKKIIALLFIVFFVCCSIAAADHDVAPAGLTMERDDAPSAARPVNDGWCDALIRWWVDVVSHVEEELPASDGKHFCGIDFGRCGDGIDTWIGELSNWFIRNIPCIILVCAACYLAKDVPSDQQLPLQLVGCDLMYLMWKFNNKMLAYKRERESKKQR